MFPVWRGIFCLEISSIFGLNVSPRALYSWSWEPPPSPLQIYSQNSPLLPLARMSPHPPTHLSFGHHVQGEFPLRGGREVPICFHHPLPLLPPIVFWGPLIESTQPLLPFYMSWLEEKYQTTDNMEITPRPQLLMAFQLPKSKRSSHLVVDLAGSSTASPFPFFVHRQFPVLPSQQLPDTITDLYTHEEVTVKCLCLDPLKYIVYVFLDSSGQIWCLCWETVHTRRISLSLF